MIEATVVNSFFKILLFVFFSIGNPYAQANGNCESLFAVTSIPEDFKHEVRALETKLGRELSESEVTAAKLASLIAEINELEHVINASEKNLMKGLTSLFWGNSAISPELRAKEDKKRLLEQLQAESKAQGEKTNQAILDKIDRWLRDNDTRFAKLREIEVRLYDILCKGDSCIQKVNNAIAEVEDAKFMEKMDLATSSKQISKLSWYYNNNANSSSHYAQNEANSFLQAAKQLKENLDTEVTSLRHFDGRINLLLDFYFHLNSTFFTYQSLFALYRLDDDLYKLRTQITEVRDAFKKEYTPIKENLDEIVCKIRKACQN